MFMTDAEISLLRLCAWCKDLPNDSAFLNTKDLGSLLLTKLLYYSRNGQSIRLTDSGREILQSIGYVYEKDNTVRSVGTRFFGGKTDVFCSSVPDRNSPLSFLPSFALRREKNKNPLGTARFNGMLYTKNTARAVYYITEENDGLYPEAERNTFTMNILTGGRKSAAAFTGDKSLEKIIALNHLRNNGSLSLCTGDISLICTTDTCPASCLCTIQQLCTC